MKHLRFLFAILLILATAGCERFTDYDFTLRNATSATAIRFQSPEGDLEPLDVTVQPGTSVLLAETGSIGVTETPPSIAEFIRGAVVTSTQGDTCLRDPNANASWTVVTELTNRRPKLYLHHYTLTLNDSDF